ncbi:hypothetical protein HMPREF0762_00955 [Slackia exigua ATCC 700122]|uniref:Uncharacterized protein n=1 Tax=Slackia exigua (strain ATCC 700122 / DSM 15923 / CIP 105133 / JCM 11022 / KCTC 5966 / S-7) TaxID=649764 RepID=D0WGK1_SLAES|nr:hypothetical protein HMPREF0762_00955 [Slackia exigua ATCC 700122]
MTWSAASFRSRPAPVSTAAVGRMACACRIDAGRSSLLRAELRRRAGSPSSPSRTGIRGPYVRKRPARGGPFGVGDAPAGAGHAHAWMPRG